MKCFITTIAIALAVNLVLAGVLPLSREQEAKIAAWKPGAKGHPWELSGQFEGDILLTDEQKRNGLINTKNRWPNKTLVYDFEASVSTAHRNTITNAIAYFTNKTCLKLKRRTSEVDYVLVKTSTSGCSSYIGRIGGAQILSLQANGCVYTGTIVHEFLHAFGFYHMQSAYDRDRFVAIISANIAPGKEHNFAIKNNSTVSHFGQTYDLKSVMHYSEYAFSSNGGRTIRALDGTSPLGNSNGLTEKDRLKLMKMYNC